MLIQGQVGPSSTQSSSPGTNPAVRQGQLGDVIVTELHGRYYEQAYRGNLFTLSVSTAAAITAYTGAAAGTPQLASITIASNSPSQMTMFFVDAIVAVTLNR